MRRVQKNDQEAAGFASVLRSLHDVQSSKTQCKDDEQEFNTKHQGHYIEKS